MVNGFDMAHLLGVDLPRPPGPILQRMEERDGGIPGGRAVPLSLPRRPPSGAPEIAGRAGCGTIGQLSLDV